MQNLTQIGTDDVELSVAQQQLWFAAQMGGDGSVYTECTGLRLRGPLHVAALTEALRRVVARHEVLRTVVVAPAGRPAMRVGPQPTAAPVRRVSLRGRGGAEQEAELLAVATAFVEAPVDLSSGPLFRVLLVELADDDHALVLAAHHLVCDAVAAAVVWSQVCRDYAAIVAADAADAAAAPSPVAEPELQYCDIAVWEREVLASHRGERDVEYWRTALDGVDPVLELPLGRSRPAAKGSTGTRSEFPVADDMGAALLALCVRQRCSAYVAMLAGYAATVHLLTGRTELVVGTLLANRRLPEVESMVGQFSTTVPLRLGLHGDPTFEQLLRRYAAVLGAAADHGRLGLGQIVQLVDPVRDPSRNALVQHLFLTREQPVGLGVLGAAALTPFEVPRTRGRFDMITEVEVAPGRVRAWVEIDTGLADPAAVADFFADYGAVLRAWVADPLLPLSGLVASLAAVPGSPALATPLLAAGHARWTALALARELARAASRAPDTELAPLAGATAVLMDRLRGGAGADPVVTAALGLRTGEIVLLHPGFRRGAAVLAAARTAGATVCLSDGSAGTLKTVDGRPVTVLAAPPDDVPWLAPGAWPALRTVVVDAFTPAWLHRHVVGELGRTLTSLVDAGELAAAELPADLPAALLTAHQAVGEVTGDSAGGLAVTVVPSAVGVDAKALTAFLADRLPAAALPVRLDVRKQASAGGPAAAVAGSDPLLAVVCALWAEVLDLPRVSADEDFFALGGHSMLCSRLTAQTAELLQVEVPLRSLFENPTAAGFTDELRRLHPGLDRLVELAADTDTDTPGSPAGSELPPLPIEPEPAGDKLVPLARAQLQLWLMEQLRPGTLTHTVPLRVTVRGPLDAAHLTGAVNDVVARQEALRSTFVEVDGVPVQRICAHATIDVPLVDVSGLVPAERAAALDRLRDETAHTGIDITTGPLLTARLIRVDTAEHALDLVFHHLVTDEVSMTVFMRELSEFYRARATGDLPRLPRLPVDLATLVAEERALLAGPQGDALRRYWIRQLAGAPELVLPTDRPRPDELTFNGEFLHRRADVALIGGMAELARIERATAFTVFLTAVLVVLRRLSGQDDIVIGVPSDNRVRPGAELLQGCFLNVLPLRVDCGGDPPFRVLLRRVRDRLLDVYDHQRLPIAEIVHAVRPQRVSNRLPLVQVTCELQLGGWMPLQLPGATCDYELLTHGTARYDLAFHGQACADHLLVAAELNTDLWDVSTGDARITEVVGVLTHALANPGSRLSELADQDAVVQDAIV